MRRTMRLYLKHVGTNDMLSPTVGFPTVRLDRQFLDPIDHRYYYQSFIRFLSISLVMSPSLIEYLSLVEHLGWVVPNPGSIQVHTLRPKVLYNREEL